MEYLLDLDELHSQCDVHTVYKTFLSNDLRDPNDVKKLDEMIDAAKTKLELAQILYYLTSEYDFLDEEGDEDDLLPIIETLLAKANKAYKLHM